MRPDMFKVIVERPRRHKDGHNAAAARRDDFEGPTFLGMRAGYGHRSLNENLTPLRRYLYSQRGRPWDKVLSELRANIDGRSTVQRHILQHLDQFVATRTWLREEEIWYATRFSGPQALQLQGPFDWSHPWLYVDPRTGILREVVRRRARRAFRGQAIPADRGSQDTSRRVVSDTEQLLSLGGIWYRVTLGTLPELVKQRERSQQRQDSRWDAVRSAWVSQRHAFEFQGQAQLGNYALFGSTRLYAVTKRQLGKRELRAAGL